MKRGEIFWASLDPTIGSEISKIRPVLIISNDINNLLANTLTILPISSSTNKIYPFEVLLNEDLKLLNFVSKIKCNQIRTIDKQRILDKIGKVPDFILSQVENALLIHLNIKKDYL